MDDRAFQGGLGFLNSFNPYLVNSLIFLLHAISPPTIYCFEFVTGVIR